MSVGLTFGSVAAPATSSVASSSSPAKKSGNAAADEFLAYMKESPAERMADAWLASHGLTREKLKAMTPEQRDAVEKQMAKDIKDQLEQQASDKSGDKLKGKPTARV